MSTPQNRAPSAPRWPYCGHGADAATDPVGCPGIHVPGHTACLAHLNDTDRDAYLATLTPGARVDHRGTPFTGELLSSLLLVLHDPTTGKPHLGTADFAGARFSDAVTFDDAQFSDTARFAEAVFSDTARFVRARFSGPADFGRARFSGPAEFGRAQFSAAAGFGRAQFFSAAEFGLAQFSQCYGAAGFKGTQFSGIARFAGTRFSGYVYFDQARFSGSADFDQARFSGTAHFDKAQFSDSAQFKEAQFSTARFRWAQFSGATDFDRARFSDSADFDQARFSDDARFGWAQFSGTVDFGDAQFSGTAAFGRAQFSDSARFVRARFSGAADFSGARFSGTWFGGAHFSGTSRFREAVFSGDVDFGLARFSDTARFDRARFSDTTEFGGAQFSGTARFTGAQFSVMSRFGPVVCDGAVDLSDALFKAPVTLQIAAREVRCERTRWESTATLRLRYASVDLSYAVLCCPVSVTTHPDPFTTTHTVKPAEVAESPLSGHPHGVRVLSVRGVDAARLTLADTDLGDCVFSGAFRLDRLRLEGRCTFAPTPTGLHRRHRIWLSRWSRRRVLAEEHHWRAQTAGQPVLLPDQAPSPRRWRAGPHHPDPDPTPGPAEVAAVYRQLRKAFESGRNEPGAADFYYGECEMRRHDRADTPWSERGLLWAYWLISGYGLRASRALGWLLAAMVGTVLLLMGWGLPIHDPAPATRDALSRGKTAFDSTPEAVLTGGWDERMTWTRAEKANRVAVNAVVFRSSGENLTTAGTYIERASRLLEPTLLALAVLAVRGRIKR
ncbi:pentapeptide repeat-containing protein [Streptomyces cavernae]|uniref:pentapeptide repeat-containing protein n=1 Tax=Streptomyces cavernae TaxID=2259034 RepID=UPI001EE4DE0C|nr:pentapeptide repeat-containing protein [Streptomyces cavernae]